MDDDLHLAYGILAIINAMAEDEMMRSDLYSTPASKGSLARREKALNDGRAHAMAVINRYTGSKEEDEEDV